MISLNKFLTSFVHSMNELDIDHCILRNYEGLPNNNPGNDIDFLILPCDIEMVIRILASIESISITEITNRFYVVSIFIYGVSWGENRTAIQIDLVKFLSWKGLPYLDSKSVFSNKNVVPGSGNLLYKPAIYHEAIISLFSSYLLGGWIKNRYQKKVQQVFATHESEVMLVLSNSLGKKTAQSLVSYVTYGNRELLLKLLPTVKCKLFARQFFNRPGRSIRNMLNHYVKEIKIRFTPYPVTSICFLGPDGSGKSSVISALTEKLSGTVKEISYVHLKPNLRNLRSIEGQVIVDDPHGMTPRSLFISTGKLAWWVILYWTDHYFHGKRNATLRIWDRYYYDVYIDPKRYRHCASLWLARLIGKFVPKPGLNIILDASEDIIQARKQEVSSEETRRQREAYLNFAKKTPGSVVLDTGQLFELTVDDGVQAILSYMQKKQNSRMRLNVAK